VFTKRLGRLLDRPTSHSWRAGQAAQLAPHAEKQLAGSGWLPNIISPEGRLVRRRLGKNVRATTWCLIIFRDMSIRSFFTMLFSSGIKETNPGREAVTGPVKDVSGAVKDAGCVPSRATTYAFLSYSRKDQGIVHQFAAYLAQEEIPPWVDNQLEYGQSWEEVIMQRIQDCTVFLIAMSPSAKESAFVNREIDVALANGKLIIPILVGGEPFPELQAYQFVNLLATDDPKTRFIERLRDLLTPDQVPSQQVQRRRVEHFVLRVFEGIMGVGQGVSVSLGIGFDEHFNVRPEQSLSELDELDWVEVFIDLRERLPHRDFHCPLGTDYKARFPTIRDFIEFVQQTLPWNEIRIL
jgi:hypothetical protein